MYFKENAGKPNSVRSNFRFHNEDIDKKHTLVNMHNFWLLLFKMPVLVFILNFFIRKLSKIF